MILKIQKSLMSTDGLTYYLIYNEDRSIEYDTTDSELESLFGPGVYKVYVDYTDESLTPCEEQPW
jgi:hypothetical protein